MTGCGCGEYFSQKAAKIAKGGNRGTRIYSAYPNSTTLPLRIPPWYPPATMKLSPALLWSVGPDGMDNDGDPAKDMVLDLANPVRISKPQP